MPHAFINGFLIGMCVCAIINLINNRHGRNTSNLESCESYNKGVLYGMAQGLTFCAIFVNRIIGSSLHGFSSTCKNCGRIFGAVQNIRMEYTRCPHCHHRQPAPLATPPANQTIP